MPSPARTLPNLLARLSRAIGSESAATEFRWMKQALHAPSARIPTSAHSLEEMVTRRVAGEPLQYILGSQPFGPLELAVRPPILIPRPETEDWTLRLAETLAPTGSRPTALLDLCTGTGCIPILLCHIWPPGSVHATGVDINPAATELAQHNARLCGIASPDDDGRDNLPHAPSSAPYLQSDPDHLEQNHERGGINNTHPRSTALRNTFRPVVADLMRSDFVAAARLRPPYDVITANPPYIPQDEYDRLSPSVREYEDVRALLGDTPSHGSPYPDLDLEVPEEDRARGLTFYHRIASLVPTHSLLRPAQGGDGGTLALEVGAGQARAVADIVRRKAGLGKIDIWRDPWGVERTVVARMVE